MVFDRTKFGPRGTNPYAPREYHYSTNDAAALVQASGYFNDLSAFLEVRDRIDAVIDLDGTPQNGYLIVTSNTGGVVDCSDFVALTDTDSD